MKVMFVGLGGVGQRHLRNLRSIVGDSLEVIAYRERKLTHVITDRLDVEQGVDIQERFGIRVFDSLPEALAQKPDTVFVCNPTSMHIPIAIAAAKQGCHLFIEKALSHTLEGISELIKLVEDKALTCMVGYQMRFHPCLQTLRDVLAGDAIGRVLAVNAEVGEYMPAWHKYEDYRQLYAARKDLGGGVIISQIHEFDYLYWLFGLPKRVFATGGHLSSLEVDVEDVASISLEFFQDGRTVPVHIHQDYLQRPPTRRCKVIGDKGKVQMDFFANTVTHFREDGAIAKHWDFTGFERNQMFMDEIQHFLSCIDAGTTPCVTVREGAQSLRMALAAKESLEKRCVIELDRDMF
jgi:predicted dehydrogenase